MTARSALFVGDASVDLTMTVDHVPAPDEKVHASSAEEAAGGVVGNAAVACARTGARVAFLGQLGDDGPGRMIAASLEAEGITVEAGLAPGGTCRVVILIEPHGEKRLLLYPGGSMYPVRSLVERQPLEGVGWVHTAVYDIDAAALLAARCRAAGIPWSVDLEPATIPDDVDRIRPFIDGAAAVFVNARAAARLGDPVARLGLLGARAVVLTRGPGGAVLVAEDCNVVAAPAPPVRAVDTTGAGDCLAGWFVAGRLEGLSPGHALRRAVVAATISCARPGGQASFPTRAEVIERLRGEPDIQNEKV